jgi:hypothetical protein
MTRASKRHLAIVGQELDALEEVDPLPPRPKTRADCIDGPRPCPWVGCRHHLYLDVSAKTGSIKMNFPEVGEGDLGELRETCALDVAARGPVTLHEAGDLLNLTRERVRVLEAMTLPKFKRAVEAHTGLMEHVGPPSDRARDFDARTFADEDLDDE